MWLIAEDAIRLAWVRLRQRSPHDFDLTDANEDAITLKLYEILVDEVYGSGGVEGFDDSVMQIGSREAKIPNFNGQHPDKMPDLHICIIGRKDVRQSQDGIFIECKPVDPDHTAGADYCNEGIIRFVRGDYAWAMTTAMMIGYATDGYEIEPKLHNALKKSSTITSESMPILCTSSSTVLFCDQTQISVHKRNFQYIESGEAAPNITLRHLWLRK